MQWSKQAGARLQQLRENNGLSRQAVMQVVREELGVSYTTGRLAEVERCMTSGNKSMTTPSPAMADALGTFYLNPELIAEAKSLSGRNGGGAGKDVSDKFMQVIGIEADAEEETKAEEEEEGEDDEDEE